MNTTQKIFLVISIVLFSLGIAISIAYNSPITVVFNSIGMIACIGVILRDYFNLQI